MTDFNKSSAYENYLIQRKNDLDSPTNESELVDQSSQGSRKEVAKESSKQFRKGAINNRFNGLVRVRTGQKAPSDKNWTGGSSLEQLLNPSNDYLNTGLLCSGFRVIDGDVEDKKQALEIEKTAERELGPTVLVRRRNNSNKFAIIYRAKSDRPKKISVGTAESKIEVLGDGQQLIVYGLHPSGVPYVWQDDRSLENTSLEDVPEVTEEQISKFLKASALILGCSYNDKSQRNLVISNGGFSQAESELASQSSEYFYHHLSNDNKDELLLACLNTRKDLADASYPEWIKVIMACKASSSPNAKEIAREWSKLSTKYDHENYEKTWSSLKKDRTDGITVGTVIMLAREKGFDTRPYQTKAKNHNAEAANQNDLLQQKILLPIEGGYYTHDAAMIIMNSRYYLVSEGGQLTFFKRCSDGNIERTDDKSIKLSTANAYVIHPTDNKKSVPLFEFWLRNPDRPAAKDGVFKPIGASKNNEFNFYQGFGVTRRSGRSKIRRLLRHIKQILCRRDRRKVKYLIKWLAWGVQNPDKAPEVAVVIKSSKEGGGKSTLSMVMVRIYGAHSKLIDDSEQLLGKHADNEHVLFVAAEEALFAGDPKTADRVKSRLTSKYIIVERKYQMARQVINRMRVILTTNHEWAIPAGEEARRWFVIEAASEMIGKHHYFDALYSDLENGGYEQFLDFLLSINLDSWHPRAVPKTLELAQQQLMSAQPVERWLMACADSGKIPRRLGSDWWHLDLGKDHATINLYQAFCDWQNAARDRVLSQVAFGVSMTKILGKNHRLPIRSETDQTRPMGYNIPNAEILRDKVFDTLGIDKSSRSMLTLEWVTEGQPATSQHPR